MDVPICYIPELGVLERPSSGHVWPKAPICSHENALRIFHTTRYKSPQPCFPAVAPCLARRPKAFRLPSQNSRKIMRTPPLWHSSSARRCGPQKRAWPGFLILTFFKKGLNIETPCLTAYDNVRGRSPRVQFPKEAPMPPGNYDYSPSPECPARKGEDEWRREPSEALAPVLARRHRLWPKVSAVACYGGWKGGLKAMESFAILIRMPRAVAQACFTLFCREV
jgi:hypothetical protein